MPVLNTCFSEPKKLSCAQKEDIISIKSIFQGVACASSHLSLDPEMYEKLLETPKLAFLKA